MEYQSEFSSSTDLSLSKVLSIKQTKETNIKDVIKFNYKQAVFKIKESYNNYLDHCYYRVPEFISTLPSYDVSKVIRLLIRFMKKKKFDCKLGFDNNIYFEWEPKKRPKDHIPFILKALTKRIELEANNNHDYLFYEVPTILPEFPWYNTEDTTILVAREIARRGFIVKIIENCIFICWNKKQLEKKSNVKINVVTKEEERQNALEKIDFINENRYDQFINPKRNKSSNINFETMKILSKPKFEPSSNFFNLYSK